LNPDVVFLVVLPPLLYSAAWVTSWREFKFNLVSILMLAFGLVGFTAWRSSHYKVFSPDLTGGWASSWSSGGHDRRYCRNLHRETHRIAARIVDILEVRKPGEAMRRGCWPWNSASRSW